MAKNIALVNTDSYLTNSDINELVSRIVEKTRTDYNGKLITDVKTLLHNEVERDNWFMVKRLTVLLESLRKVEAMSYHLKSYYNE
jgi:hypothetical protein